MCSSISGTSRVLVPASPAIPDVFSLARPAELSHALNPPMASGTRLVFGWIAEIARSGETNELVDTGDSGDAAR